MSLGGQGIGMVSGGTLGLGLGTNSSTAGAVSILGMDSSKNVSL